MTRRMRRFIFTAIAVVASVVLYVKEARADVFAMCASSCTWTMCACGSAPPCMCFEQYAGCLGACIADLCDILPNDPDCVVMPEG